MNIPPFWARAEYKGKNRRGATETFEEDYTQKDAQFKVCELVSKFGSAADIPSIQRIVAIHDCGTRIGLEAPLA